MELKDTKKQMPAGESATTRRTRMEPAPVPGLRVLRLTIRGENSPIPGTKFPSARPIKATPVTLLKQETGSAMFPKSNAR
jgi:hypothetical protein